MADYTSSRTTASSAYILRQIHKDAVKAVADSSFKGLAYDSHAGMSVMFSGSLLNVTGEVHDIVKTFSENLKFAANRKEGLADAHKRVAVGAQAKVVAKYRGIVKGPTYRKNQDRYAGGALERAINDSSFSLATRDGLFFINRTLLNQKAKQWRRYNYGAGMKGTSEPRDFPMTFFGASAGRYGLSGQVRSKGFIVPYGIFLGAGGKPSKFGAARGEAFYTFKWYRANVPVKTVVGRSSTPDGKVSAQASYDSDPFRPRAALTKPKVAHYNPLHFFGGPTESEGIQGRQIFDAGTAYIARELPKEYEAIVKKWFKDASKRKGSTGPLGKAGVSRAYASKSSKFLKDLGG